MSIVTKTGDGGTTGLYGGRRIAKDHERIHAYGEVDELNAAIGVVLSSDDMPPEIGVQLSEVQHLLFRVGGDLATPLDQETKQERVGAEHVSQLEEWIKEWESVLPPQRSFIVPGGTQVASLLHLARTVCRRAERSVVSLQKRESVNLHVPVLLNRLSDYLFLLARAANVKAEMSEEEVRY